MVNVLAFSRDVKNENERASRREDHVLHVAGPRVQNRSLLPWCLSHGRIMSSLVTTVTVVSLAAVAGVVGADTASQGAASPLCFGKHATITGTDAVVERIDGTPGDDVISGGRGIDRIFGGAGNDRICAGRARGSVHGGPGDDRLRAAKGNGFDVAWLREGPDRASMGRKRDRVYVMRDDVRDRILCGRSHRDVAFYEPLRQGDPVDAFISCEAIRRIPSNGGGYPSADLLRRLVGRRAP
ncbi:MAG TPA: hypothetical protein VLK34_07625 [Nocardioidaceae bacterium]|nr:hypothetical protein [Nocardioidaceae bacterium]